MSRTLSRLQAVVLGLVVVVGLVLAGSGLFAVGSRHWPWNEPFLVRTSFPKVQGVEAGTHVRVQGMDAGEVESVDLPDQRGAAALNLKLGVHGSRSLASPKPG